MDITIIPQRNSIQTLARLFDSIPVSSQIEIILVDNSLDPIKKEDVGIDRDYILLHADSKRYAGGARNVGIENAHGKWLVFADADDFFAQNAFDVFDSYLDSDAEIIYFCAQGIYSDTMKLSDRGNHYTSLVQKYIKGEVKEQKIRFDFSVPWAKMIKKELVDKNNIRFAEVIASNDIYFSLLAGYHAKKIDAVEQCVYFVSTTRGSLTNRRNTEVNYSQYLENLKRNFFLREKGFSAYQASIMVFFFRAFKFSKRRLFRMFGDLIRYRQNPFVGWENWFNTYFSLKKKEKNNIYITIIP